MIVPVSLDVNLGVPQTSLLRPLLFNLYINDLKAILDPQRIQYIFYTDDLQIYLQVSKDKILEDRARISDAAWLATEWARGAYLQFYAGTTQAIILGSKINLNNLNIPDSPKAKLEGGDLVPFTNTVVSLGVTPTLS